jgi:hypothetical protein
MSGMTLGLLITIAFGICYWIYVFWPIFKRKRKLKNLGAYRSALLQIPVTLAFLMILFGFNDFIYAAITPPLFLLLTLDHLVHYATFFLPIVVVTILITTIFVFALLNKFGTLRNYTWSIATLIFIPVFFGSADLQTKRLQSMVIQNARFECVNLKSFWHSAKKRGYEFQVGPHTTAKKDGKSYGWSFRTLDFYEIPQTVLQNIEPVC